MREESFRRPDEAAMARLLEANRLDPTGIVLRLAWRAGLTRKEICALTWDGVDLDGKLLRLSDREVPLEPETAEILRAWRERVSRLGPYVAVSERFRRRLTSESIPNMARKALDSAGQTAVRLIDLRYDFIRRQFETHDWPYVLRVAGISLTTYRNTMAGLFPEKTAGETRPRERENAADEEFALWRVMQAERASPAGVALWLSTRLGLQSEEICALTWDQVDFKAGLLRLPNREIDLTVTVRHVLEEVHALRRPGDGEHVVLTPRSRVPMDAGRLTTVVRAALIRGGIEDKTLRDFRRDSAWEAERETLLERARAENGITRREAEALLGMSEGRAYARLSRLEAEGALVRVGGRYYPAGTAPPPEGREEAVLRYLSEHGPSPRREVEAHLRVGRHKATALLKHMAEAGDIELVPGSWRYALAKDNNMTFERREDAATGTDN